MKPGGSGLNPSAAAYVPLSKSEGDSSKPVAADAATHDVQHQQPYGYGVQGKGSSPGAHMRDDDSEIDMEMEMEFLLATFSGLSDESIGDVYLANNGDLDETIEMVTQLERTPSITRITIEVDDTQTPSQDPTVAMAVVDGGHNYDHRFLAMFSPRNHKRNERKDSGKSSLPSSSFLGSCGFCKRRLAPGRDIYMYKGDAAFCSVECREQQMEHDEGKGRNSVVLSPSN